MSARTALIARSNSSIEGEGVGGGLCRAKASPSIEESSENDDMNDGCVCTRDSDCLGVVCNGGRGLGLGHIMIR